MNVILSCMKYPLIPIYCLLLLLIPGSTHASADFAELAEELEIMEQVFFTTLKQDDNKPAIKVSRIKGDYLANQGVVFSVSTSSRSWSNLFDSHDGAFEFLLPDVEFPVFDELNLQAHQETIHEALTESGIFQVENMNEVSEKLRELESQLREHQWQLRDVEREKRDLEFELRRADELRKKEIQEELSALEKALEKANTDQKSLKEAAQEISDKRKQKAEQKREERRNANRAFLNNFEKDVSDTLCRFGAGLRALPQDEHITFVLNNFDTSFENKGASRYYVFSVENVKRCSQDKISASDLLARATVYDF